MATLRKDVKKTDAWNTEALYPSFDAWKKELSQFPDGFKEMLPFKGMLTNSAETLKNSLTTYFSIERKLRKLYTFAHLKHDEDITEIEAKNAYETITGLYHQFSQMTSWLQPELLLADEKVLETLMNDPLLSEYHFFLEKLVRLKPHTLSIDQEELVALANQALDTPQKAFSALNNADFVFGTVENSQGETLELTHASYGLFLRNPDRILRENAFKKLHGQFKSYENTLAEVLSGQVQSHFFNARARKYASCLDAALFPKNIDTAVYRSLIDAVHNKISELHKYTAVRKKALGVDKLQLWDMYVPLVKNFEITMSYDEAEEIVIESTKPLGDEYVHLLKEGLKTDRWVDRYENKNKRSGAYSSGCFDSMPYILMNYKGILRDVFTLAHEAGHSMHSLLSRKNQPYHYSDYAIFVAEVASTFNEELLSKMMIKRAKSAEEKLFLINEKIEDIRATLFRQVMFAEFELFIHEAAEKRVPITADFLSTEFRRLNQFYFGDEVVIDDAIAIEWARIPHFYYNFYVYQYATGIAAALALNERVIQGGTAERDAYLGFLQAGSSDYPIEILKKAGVDMRSNEPVMTAIDRFSALVEEFSTLQEELESAKLATKS